MLKTFKINIFYLPAFFYHLYKQNYQQSFLLLFNNKISHLSLSFLQSTKPITTTFYNIKYLVLNTSSVSYF